MVEVEDERKGEDDKEIEWKEWQKMREREKGEDEGNDGDKKLSNETLK